MNYELLGQNIRRARIDKKMTQEVLASQIGCSTVFISEIEKAKKRPSLETLQKISLSLQVGIDDLFYGKQSPVESSQVSVINNLLRDRTTAELALARELLEVLFRSLDAQKEADAASTEE